MADTIATFVLLFVISLIAIIGIVLYVLLRRRTRESRRLAPPPTPPVYPPPTQTVYREKETVREVVKVACRYCGILADVTATNCPKCGSPVR